MAVEYVPVPRGMKQIIRGPYYGPLTRDVKEGGIAPNQEQLFIVGSESTTCLRVNFWDQNLNPTDSMTMDAESKETRALLISNKGRRFFHNLEVENGETVVILAYLRYGFKSNLHTEIPQV